MDIDLDERRVTNTAEAMYLSGLDDKDVTCAGFEFLSVDCPETAAFPHELDFIVGMSMGSRTTPREGAEEERGDVHVAVIGPNEVVRAALKWQVLLTNTVHPAYAPREVWLLDVGEHALAQSSKSVYCRREEAELGWLPLERSAV
jgi:hypothetical protein